MMNKQIYFWVRRAFYSMQCKGHDTDSAWKHVASKCKLIPRYPVKLQYIKYAAILFLFISVGIYIWYQQHSHLPSKPTTGIIKPSYSNAELILANGQRILLKKSKEHISVKELGVQILQDSTNHLLYKADSSVPLLSDTIFNQLKTSKGGEYSLKLPDGSQVYLNSESTLQFPVHFAVEKREVFLQGEAFFEITKNENAPFIVHLEERKVIVLGTRFNVSAYPEDPSLQITLVEGKVAIQTQEDEKILQPSEQYILNNISGDIKIIPVNTALYSSWLQGKFYFKNYRLEDIVKKLERWYDFKISYQQENIKEMYFRGVINKHHPLEEVLRNLEATTNIAFDINGKNIVVKKRNNNKKE